MKIHIYICLLASTTILAASINGYAGEPSDSIQTSVQLEGIVVEGQTDYTKADKIVFKPTENQIKTSQNLTDLLMNSVITNIKVDPMGGGGVKTLLNEDVEVYVNYAKAKPSDIEGVKLDEIKRIEYLDYPNDARFCGDRHVLNIILYPQSGGYTKIRPGVKIDPFEVSPQVYSKYNVRNFTFDIFTQCYYASPHDNGESQTSRFYLNPQTSDFITRKQQFLSSKGKEMMVPVTLRMSYDNDRVQIRNAFGYVFSKNRNTAFENISLSTTPDDLISTESFVSQKSNEVSWEGDYSFMFDKGYQLSIGTTADYSHNNNINHYIPDNDNIVIGYNAYDNVFLSVLDANLSKEITPEHSVGFNGQDVYRLYNTHYTFPAKFDRQYLNYIAASVFYSFNKNKVASRLSLGFASTLQKSTGIKKLTDNMFVYNLSVNWSPNRRNYFNFVSRLDNALSGASSKTNILVQQNELLWKQGNPDLRPAYVWINNISYTAMPNSWLTLSASADNTLYTDRDIRYYTLLKNGEGILESYVNSGNFDSFRIIANVGGRFFNNSLHVNLTGQYEHIESTGICSYKKNYFTGIAYATYSIKDFFISAYFASRQVRALTYTPEITRHYPDYRFDFGWSKFNLKLRLTVFNPFRKTKAAFVSSFSTPVYATSNTYFDTLVSTHWPTVP